MPNRATARLCAIVVWWGCCAVGGQAQQLTAGYVGAIDPTGQVAFSLTFDRVPDFLTVGANNQRFGFQFLISTDATAAARTYASLIRGGEIHVAGDIPVRNGGPSDTSDPNSGGWGSVRGRVKYALEGTTLTFSVPATVLNVDGPFTYHLDLTTTGSFSGAPGGPIKLVPDPSPSETPPIAPDSIAGRVFRGQYYDRALLGESTIVFDETGRFTYLLDRFVDSGNIDFATRILPPRGDGRYRYSRLGSNTASVELNYDDGKSGGLALVFATPTTGMVGGTAPNSFSLTNLGTWGAAAARNVSMRGNVAPGRPLVVGLVIPGSSEVLIRAVGPSLRSYGVSGVWEDPDFQLYRGGAPYASGEIHSGNWEAPAGGLTAISSGPGLRKVFSYVGAFPLLGGSTDAADVVRLSAGNYSIVCHPAAGDPGGEVLVEVYFLP